MYTHRLSLRGTGCHVSQFPTSCLSESSTRHDFQSHLSLSNLGIDGDYFKGHLRLPLSAGLWRTLVCEYTSERGQLYAVDSSQDLSTWVRSHMSLSDRLIPNPDEIEWPLWLVVGDDVSCRPSPISRRTSPVASVSSDLEIITIESTSPESSTKTRQFSLIASPSLCVLGNWSEMEPQ